MIGTFSYTVLLTYLSALSAGAGIVITLTGMGHPYVGIFFLMVSGFCDAFDGRVARRKKDRTDFEKKFGIQIDSLSDLIAFGVLPICIAHATVGVSPAFNGIWGHPFPENITFSSVFFMAIMLWYILAALIRLAYYNVTEEELQSEGGRRTYYVGLPVTAAAVVFPLVMLLQYLLEQDITLVYFIIMLVMGIAFVSNVKVPKINFKVIIALCIIGLAEFITLIVYLN